jgi:hypothetical protein
MTSNAMTSKIKTVVAIGLVAAFASPAFAALDVEANPLASGRYVAGAPGPIVAPIVLARADATRHASAHTDQTSDSVQFERAVGGIR